MKPQIIRAQGLGHPETHRILRWLEANGLRHYIPEYAKIRVHGNRFTVETFDIERVGQKNTKWAMNRWVATYGENGRELPRKARTYRIRHDLKDIR